MTQPFKVEAEDIGRLSDIHLTQLLKELLYSEAAKFGIAQRSVEVALNITVGDGGEDGRISWVDGPESTDYVPGRLALFQCKATDIGPKGCAKEILDTHGNIKASVLDVLSQGGAYLIFTTQKLNTKQKKLRIDAIRSKILELHAQYAADADLKIYDASQISGWVNQHVPAIVFVLSCIGRPLERGVKSFSMWGTSLEIAGSLYSDPPSRREILEDLRRDLLSEGCCSRITGLSGLGKTRIAYEAVKGSPDLESRVVYIDAENCAHSAALIADWVSLGLIAVVVLDNCETALHEKVSKEVKRTGSKVSVLSLDYNPDSVSNSKQYFLNPLLLQEIKDILLPVYGERIQDLDRVAEFAQGFPQIAVLLAQSRIVDDPTMGFLADDIIASRLLWDRGLKNEVDEMVLKGCSLFDSFGIEGEVESQYKYIADHIVSVTYDVFYDCIKRFERRKIIDKRGRFVRVIPKPLAIRLAAQWWGGTRPEKQKEIIASLPPDLIESFCSQISKLDFLPHVKDLTSSLCGIQSPFGQAEVILSIRGSQLFRAFVEVNPEETSSALYRIFSRLNYEDIISIEADVRRNLVWALEKLCFHAECFDRSAYCLMRLAEYENERYSNNATGILSQLFRVFLSGTSAPISQRLQLLRGFLGEGRDEIILVVVKVLASALRVNRISMTAGAENQGTRPPLEEWRPKIWQEAFDYWDECIRMLGELSTGDYSQLIRDSAKQAVASSIREMLRYGRVEALNQSIRSIVGRDGALWIPAMESINNSLEYDAEKMPADVKAVLNEWLELLKPDQLKDKIKLLISLPPFEHKEGADGHFIDIAKQNAEKFADEVSKSTDELIPVLSLLLVGEQRHAFTFGRALVLAGVDWEKVWSEAISVFKGLSEANSQFIEGILAGVWELNPIMWQEVVDSSVSDDALVPLYVRFVCTGKVSEKSLVDIADLVDSGRVLPGACQILGYGGVLSTLSPAAVSAFIERISNISEDSKWIALDILSMYCHGDSDKKSACKENFYNILSNLPIGKIKLGSQMRFYMWRDSVDKLLEARYKDFDQLIFDRIIESVSLDIDYSFLWHDVQPVLSKILSAYPDMALSKIGTMLSDSEPLNAFLLKQMFNSGNSFDMEKPSVISAISDNRLLEWCDEFPDVAPEFIARSLDVYVPKGEEFEIPDLLVSLIEKCGADEDVMSAISANMHSFGWSGSLVPYYEKSKAALAALLDHRSPYVRRWATAEHDYVVQRLVKEKTKDEERGFGIY